MMTSYQFALLRYVHNASTEEFVNIGVVMWLPAEQQFIYQLTERYARLSAFFADFNGKGYRRMLGELKAHLRAASQTEERAEDENIKGLLPQLVPFESGCFQWSAAMGGIAPDPQKRLQQLFAEIITRHELHHERPRREESDILRDLYTRLRQRGLEQKLAKDVPIVGANFSFKFKLGWQNGKPQVAHPLSFDYAEKDAVLDKANKWLGRLHSLKGAQDYQLTAIVAPPQNAALLPAYHNALEILRDAPNIRALVPESRAEDFLVEVEQDLAAHG